MGTSEILQSIRASGPWGGGSSGGGNRGSGGGSNGGSGGGSGGNPWGQGGGQGGGNRGSNNGGQRPPNLEDILKRGGEMGGLPGGFSKKMIPLILLAIVALWLASGFYRVESAERGIVRTFGEHTGITGAGLNWHIPWPVQSVITVDVEEKRNTDIGFQAVGSNKRDVPIESQMITGDQNIIDLDATVIWRISSPEQFLFEITQPEQTVKIAAESALREIIGRTNIVDALTVAKDKIEVDTRALLQATLDSYKAGITIDDMLLQEVKPPREVEDAFNDVQRAIQDRDTQQNQANQYSNRVTQEAQGQVQVIIKSAEGYKEQLENQSAGEAQRFEDLLSAYQENPEVTRKRLYIEAMEKVFSERDAIVIDPALQNGSLIINSGGSNGQRSRILPVPQNTNTSLGQ